MKKICRIDVKVIHYGYSSEKKIDKKYQLYKEHGQTGWLLERLRSEKGIKIKPFSKDYFPPSVDVS